MSLADAIYVNLKRGQVAPSLSHDALGIYWLLMQVTIASWISRCVGPTVIVLIWQAHEVAGFMSDNVSSIKSVPLADRAGTWGRRNHPRRVSRGNRSGDNIDLVKTRCSCSNPVIHYEAKLKAAICTDSARAIPYPFDPLFPGVTPQLKVGRTNPRRVLKLIVHHDVPKAVALSLS